MKYFSVLLCLFLYYELSTQEPRRPFHGGKRSNGFFHECQELSGLSRDELREFEHSSETQDKLLNGEGDFKNIGCFLACLNQKFGVMTGNTFIRDDLSHYELGELELQRAEAWNACMDTAEKAGGDECDVALAFHVCFEKAKRALPPAE
ncbi:odorant binding protein 12 [Lasioglossum baleicum]|uniref:odorant binding protein 12 n=1 Tax=Lasioglossum baleicum TaxID=434251 RepID=UPI003FCD7281